uniref:Sugar phosphate transporter domain-containing protein n=1 Tax=Eutreptiella gymnastica TaxID=73025 RepID=A0A7S1IEU1_9EUGL|mmetsp:Transcript_15191/g.26922  ORF Transcript_15191/g.26922 Transcript_15191/m.26922 type:complete len:349 (+) Transcript_15191:23-1069(+)
MAEKDADSVPLARAVLIWSLNIFSGVSIIMVNKKLMGPKEYNFHFPVTLCAIHFLITSMMSKLGTEIGVCNKPEKSVNMPKRDLAVFTFVANTSIVALNLSLMANSIMLYQISKLAVVPFTCLVEMAWYGRQFSNSVIFCILLTLFGMAMVSVSELRVTSSIIGVVALVGSIVGSGMQQLLCRHYQKSLDISSNDLLAKTAFSQGATLLLTGPVLDYFLGGSWVHEYSFKSTRTFQFLVMSCLLAAAVNFSQFMVLGKFTAVTLQLVGHLKTILVLVLGWLLFGGVVSETQMMGMFLALGGLAGYTIISQEPKPAPTVLTQRSLENPASPRSGSPCNRPLRSFNSDGD